MAKRTWEFDIKGNKHTVRLKHGAFSGKREIWVDGQLIMKVRNFVDYGSQNPFSIDDVPCELGITTNGITYDYFLLVDGKRINALGRKEKKPANATRKAIAEVEFWRKLSALSGLRYLPTPNLRKEFRHRLIGPVRGYLTIIRSALFGNSAITIINVMLRISPITDVDDLREKLKSEFRDLKKQDKKIMPDSLDIRQGYVSISVMHQPQKEPPEVAFSKINQVVAVFSKYVRPLSSERCDGPECKSRIGQELQLGFVNGYPTYLCKDCIDRIPLQGQKAQDEYKKAPSGLVKGLAAGIIAAVLGGLAWAAVAVFLNLIHAAIAGLILILVIRAMDKVGTKRTVWSVLLGGLISLIGIVIGVYFTYMLYDFTHPPERSIPDVLERSWKILLKFGEFFTESLLFGLIGIVLYLWTLVSGTKKQIAMLAKPNVEIIEGFDLPR